MKKYKDREYIECNTCGNMFKYSCEKITKQYESYSNSNYIVYCYTQCPECQNLILVDKYNINSKID